MKERQPIPSSFVTAYGKLSEEGHSFYRYYLNSLELDQIVDVSGSFNNESFIADAGLDARGRIQLPGIAYPVDPVSLLETIEYADIDKSHEVFIPVLSYCPHNHGISHSMLTMHCDQAYYLERELRRYLVLQDLLPVMDSHSEKTARGIRSITQTSDGKAHITPQQPKAKTAVLGIPYADGRGGVSRMSILYQDCPVGYLAAYVPHLDSYVFSRELYTRITMLPVDSDTQSLTADDRLALTMRHEEKHRIYENYLTSEERAAVDAMFDMDHQLLRRFITSLMKLEEYRCYAIAESDMNQYAKDVPYIPFVFQGRHYSIEKSWLVNEIIGHASWQEVVSREKMLAAIIPSMDERKYLLQQNFLTRNDVASEYMNALPSDCKQLLYQMGLYTEPGVEFTSLLNTVQSVWQLLDSEGVFTSVAANGSAPMHL
ncbi:MAG: hypothetical protein ACOCXQ_03215 [Patescibacteria group bacterium]